jgi:hypothetical protein
MLRQSCIDCALKHIAQAQVLYCEAELGYPVHRLLAIGHLAEAEAELVESYPKLANMVRDYRLHNEDLMILMGYIYDNWQEEEVDTGHSEVGTGTEG